MPATLLITEKVVFLPKWGCSLTVLFTPDGSYCVLRQLCQIVGVEDVRQQYEQLLRRQATRDYVTKLPVQTPRRGKQITYCIHLDVLAWWLAGLNERLIRPEFAPQLVRFQKDIVRVANDLLFGAASWHAHAETTAKGKIIRLQDWLGASAQQIDISVRDGLQDEEGDDEP
jgi:hypothetical protein